MSNQISILTEVSCMWQVTEPFKSIVKNRTEIFSPFFFLTAQEGWEEEGQLLTDKTKLNTKALQVSSTPLASCNGILSPLQKNSTLPPECNTPRGLTGTAWTIQTWPFAVQHSLLCLGHQQGHLPNSTTGKSSMSLPELTVPTTIPDLILWWNHLSMRMPRSENCFDTKSNRQREGQHIPLQILREAGQSGSSKAHTQAKMHKQITLQ